MGSNESSLVVYTRGYMNGVINSRAVVCLIPNFGLCLCYFFCSNRYINSIIGDIYITSLSRESEAKSPRSNPVAPGVSLNNYIIKSRGAQPSKAVHERHETNYCKNYILAFQNIFNSPEFQGSNHDSYQMVQPANPVNCNLPREGVSTLLHRSCNACNRRKVRCNKESPCDNCVRLGFECTFPPPGRKARTRPTKSSKTELISRLSLLEREVQKLGAQKAAADVPVDSLEDQDIEESPESSSTVAPWPSKTPASVEAEAEEEVKEEGTGIHGGQIILEPDPDTSESTLGHQFGRLVINRSSGTSRYVNHRVLTDLGDQVNCAPLSLRINPIEALQTAC